LELCTHSHKHFPFPPLLNGIASCQTRLPGIRIAPLGVNEPAAVRVVFPISPARRAQEGSHEPREPLNPNWQLAIEKQRSQQPSANPVGSCKLRVASCWLLLAADSNIGDQQPATSNRSSPAPINSNYSHFNFNNR